MPIKLSVVVPSYNETQELKRKAIDEMDAYLREQGYSSEVIIVDDQSTNGTLDFVKEHIKSKPNFRLIENSHGGKAITVMTGMLESKGDVTLFTDMDQSTPINQIEKLLPKFDEGYDLVIGSRRGRKGAPLIRKLMANGFLVLRGLILGLPIKDTQCGFKVFNREAIDLIFPSMLKDWKKMRSTSAAVNAGFDVEVLFLAKIKGLKIAEVEVEWHHIQNERQVQAVRDSLEAIKDMLRIRINSWMGKY